MKVHRERAVTRLKSWEKATLEDITSVIALLKHVV